MDNDVLKTLYDLYEVYKTSVPSRGSKVNKYFKARDADELTDEQLCCNPPRFEAEQNLMKYFKYIKENNLIAWDDDKWFWICPEDSELVLLKSWF